MRGAFGGDFEAREATATEAVDAALAALLSDADAPAPPVEPALVAIRAVAGALSYEGDLRGLAPLSLEARDPRATLAELAPAFAALQRLHARGRAHGDLRPGHVWSSAAASTPGTRLSYLAKEVDALQVLRARLRGGAEPGEVDFAAPEVLAGASATPASDVFSAGALIHAALVGRAPHGRPGSLRARHPGLAPLEVVVARALDPEPALRPSLAELAAAVAGVATALALPDPAVAPEAQLAPAADPDAPALAGAGPRVALVSPGVAARPPAPSSGTPVILTCLLAVGGFFLLSGAIWFAAATFGTLGEVGRFALLFTLSAAVAGGGFLLERGGYRRSGLALLVIVTQLVWANGAYLVVEIEQTETLEAWFLLAAVVTALTEAFALTRRSAVLASIGVVDTVIACALAGAICASNRPEGPALWCLATALVLGALAYVGHRRGGLRTGLAPAIGATLFVLLGWGCALGLLGWAYIADGGERTFASAGSCALAIAACGAAAGFHRLGARAYTILSIVLASVLVTFTPTCLALGNRDAVAFRYGATLIGGGMLVAAFHWPRIAKNQGLQLLVIASGLVSVAVAPVFLALQALGDRFGPSADSLFMDVLDPSLSIEDRMQHPLFSLAYLCGISGVLVGLGVLFAKDEAKKLPYRLLQTAGLAAFFFTLTILSILRGADFLFPIVLFLGGFLSIGVGAWRRHVLLVVLPAAALVLNVWVQYFAKLSDAVPLALLLMGFGVGVLVGGVLFEKRVRPYLPGLKTWA